MVTRREFMVWAGAAAAGGVVAPRLGLADLVRRGDRILGWEELRPGVHVSVDFQTGGNVLAAAGSAAVLVIDSKYPFMGPALRADAVTLAGGHADVTLINTHHHGDHTAGNVGFTGEGPVLAHATAVKRVVDQVDRFKQWAANAPSQAHRIARDNAKVQRMAREIADRAEELGVGDWEPTGTLADGAEIPVKGVRGAVRHFGVGHTDNDLVIHLAEANVVHTGDLVFNALHPFFDRDGGVTAFGWVESLQKTRALCDADTVVVPGHGPVGDRSIIDGQIGYIEQLIEAVQGDIDAGVDRDDTLAKEFPFMVGLGFASARQRAIAAVHDELTERGG